MEFITKQEVKDILGIDERTYQTYLKDGILKPYKISDDSRIFKFDKSDVVSVFKKPKEARIITVANNKGGTGKSTISYNLAHVLSENNKVLCIDLDIQGNLSVLFNVDIDNLKIDNFTNMDIIKISENLYILPANITLSSLELEIQNKINREKWLEKNIISKVIHKYDYIILDTSPSLNLLNLNAFSSSHLILIPVNPDTLSIVGLDTIIGIIKEIQNNINSKLNYKIIMNKFTKGRVLTTEIMDMLGQHYNKYLLPITINHTQKVIDSVALKQPVKDKDILKSLIDLKEYIEKGMYE